MSEETTTIIKCDCHGECIAIDYDPKYNETDISFWSYGGYDDNTLTWKDRIRYCWQILRKGKPYGDQVCFMGKQKIVQLRKTLQNIEEKIDAQQVNK